MTTTQAQQSTDLIDVLSGEHREVERLFAKLEARFGSSAAGVEDTAPRGGHPPRASEGVHPETRRPATPAGDCSAGGQDSAAGRGRGAQRHLRGGLSRLLPRVPARAHPHQALDGCPLLSAAGRSVDVEGKAVVVSRRQDHSAIEDNSTLVLRSGRAAPSPRRGRRWAGCHDELASAQSEGLVNVLTAIALENDQLSVERGEAIAVAHRIVVDDHPEQPPAWPGPRPMPAITASDPSALHEAGLGQGPTRGVTVHGRRRVTGLPRSSAVRNQSSTTDSPPAAGCRPSAPRSSGKALRR